jgi:hypothetical protein
MATREIDSRCHSFSRSKARRTRRLCSWCYGGAVVHQGAAGSEIFLYSEAKVGPGEGISLDQVTTDPEEMVRLVHAALSSRGRRRPDDLRKADGARERRPSIATAVLHDELLMCVEDEAPIFIPPSRFPRLPRSPCLPRTHTSTSGFGGGAGDEVLRGGAVPEEGNSRRAVASCATAGGGARQTVACSDGTAYGFSRIISPSLLDDAFFGGARMTNSYVSGWTAGHFVKQRGDEEERGRAPTTRSKRASGYGSGIYDEEIGRRRSSVSAVRSSRGRRFVRRGGPHVSLLKQRKKIKKEGGGVGRAGGKRKWAE